MEKQSSFVLKLSLEELALRRVVVSLWNGSEILSSIQNFKIKKNYPYGDSEVKDSVEWRETVEEKVIDKVPQLLLPEIMEKRIMHFVRPVGYEILRWKIFHREAPIPDQLCWTSAGTVDYRKTAGKVARLRTTDAVKRYELACRYCLEDCIPYLWEELPERNKRRFYVSLKESLIRRMPLETYWAYVVKGEEAKLCYFAANRLDGGSGIRLRGDSFYQLAFQHSARTNNKAGVEYFFQKLTDEERDPSLLRAADIVIQQIVHYKYVPYAFKQERVSDLLYCLLSLMNPVQQMHILEKYPYEVLSFSLYWPWQGLFLDIADLVWIFLPVCLYDKLSDSISGNITNACYYFPDLIQKFFLRSPGDFRRHLVTAFIFLFLEFSYDENIETIEVFLRNIDPESRLSFVFSDRFLLFLHALLRRDKWRLAQKFIQEAALSNENRKNLKQEFINIFHSGDSTDEILPRSFVFKRFLQILDGTEVTFPALPDK